MKPPSDVAFSAFQCSLLQLAATLVPSPARQEWRREWLAELWHVRQSYVAVDDSISLASQREITCFCLGAFPDALCLRFQPSGRSELGSQPAHSHMHGSAGQTLLWLAAAMVLCLLITQLLPGVTAENEAAQFQISPNVLLISEAAETSPKPSIDTALYLNWKNTQQRFFDNLAFYRLNRESVELGSRRISWNVAHASKNIFSLLGLPVVHPDGTDSELPSIILSHEIWTGSFAGDPHIAGTVIRLNHARVRIVGIAPAGAWNLPGTPAVWQLESDAQTAATVPAHTPGYLLAHLSERGRLARLSSGLTISARDLQDVAIDVSGTSLDAPVEGPWNLCQFALFLALVALPAVSSVSLGETHLTSYRASRRESFRRLLFLASKFALAAGIGIFGSFDLAYWYTPNYSSLAECFQVVSCFSICLLGFRWALADQRQRCPVCLRRVTNPASVGLASRTFLGWNGTEMVCMGGHTLLHVPALPTSWFSDQRWLYLDSSWQFLFADSGMY